MRKLLIGIICFLCLSTSALAANRAILFEVGIGFGKSGKIEYTEEERKTLDLSVCRNRNVDGMTYVGVRLRNNDVELHGAKWWHETNKANCNCDRDAYALGLGYVVSSEDTEDAKSGLYASWTPGVAYTWNTNKNFTLQTETRTNWRLASNLQVFNRVAIGANVGSGRRYTNMEFAVVQYGSFEVNHGERFFTAGLGVKRFNRTGGTDEHEHENEVHEHVDVHEHEEVHVHEEVVIHEHEEVVIHEHVAVEVHEHEEVIVEVHEHEEVIVEVHEHEEVVIHEHVEVHVHEEDEEVANCNNGGGNGDEGCSPGQGSEANDDES